MKSLRLLSIASMLVIIVQFAMPYRVLADDTTPPPAVTEEVPPAQPEGAGTETTVDLAPDPVLADDTTTFPATTEEVPPVEADTSGTEAAVDSTLDLLLIPDPTPRVDPTVGEETTAEIIQEIPAEMEIVVLGETRQPVPLATQEAADILVTGDPMWCPVDSKPGDGDCSTSYGSLNALLADIGSTIDSEGTIWITSGAVPETGPVSIDGSIYTTWAAHSLTLQGGWDGVIDQAGTILPTNSTFNVPLAITNWNGAVSIRNIDIENAADTGLTIQTAGPVDIANVNATGNQGDGVKIQTNSDVNVNQVHSNQNTGNGLTITAAPVVAPVTYDETFYPDPGTYGYGETPIEVETRALVIVRHINYPQHIRIAGSEFNDNDGNGLAITTSGPITLSGVTANRNRANGAVIDHFTNITPPFPWSYFQNLPYPQPYELYALEPENYYIGSRATSIVFNENEEYGMLEQGQATPFHRTDIGNFIFVWPSGFAVEMIGNGKGTDFTEDAWSMAWPTGMRQILGGEDIDLGDDEDDPSVGADQGTGGDLAGAAGVTVADHEPASKNKNKPLCEQMSIFALRLPNDDNVVVYCPISGAIKVDSLGRKTLPAALPEGYTYLSALEINLAKNSAPIQVIQDAGHLGVSFAVPADQAGKNLVILFWDTAANKWIELPISGSEKSASLQNGRTVLKGVQLLNNIGRVEVDVNFPGIFVLAVK